MLKGVRPRFAVIPTNGRACLKDCVQAIKTQVDSVFLVYTSPWADGELRPGPRTFPGIAIRDLREPKNISRWWNQGLSLAKQVMDIRDETERYDVAVLNDDVIVPPDWFSAVSTAMRVENCAAACSGGNFQVVQHVPGPVPLDTRMQGFAFILAGEKGIEANEDLRWYFSDDYIDWKAREAGGMVMIRGLPVQHLYPNGQMTPELHHMCGEDAAKFLSMWGRMPW